MSGFDKLFKALSAPSRSDQIAARNKMMDAAESLLASEPFFATIVYGMKWLHDHPNLGGQRMGVDGFNLYYSTPFVLSTPPEVLKGVIAHEAMHVVFDHINRIGEREHDRWNVATDAVINPILLNHGYALPEDRVKFPVNVRETAEEVYERLPTNPSGGGGGGFDIIISPNVQEEDGTMRPATPEEREAIKRGVIQAAQEARKAGQMPGYLESIIDGLYTSPRDWRDELRKFLGGGELREQSWATPNRRYIGDDLYLPGGGRYGPGQVGLFVDTSSSVNDEMAGKFVGEVRKINQDLMPEVVHVVACDARVQWAEDFSPYEDITCRIVGRGGTDFRPPFAYAQAQGWNLKAAVYFTDLECTSYPPKPDYPVLWVVWPNGRGPTPPFGEVIRMNS